jgi:hypothetical protein
VVVTGHRYAEKPLVGCVNASVSDDVGVPLAIDIEIGVEFGRGGSLPEAMAESFLTCATVGSVASYGIRGGAGSRGQARVRRKRYPRVSSTSGEVEFAPEGRSVLLSYYMSRQGMSGDVCAQQHMRNHVVGIGQDCGLVVTVCL